MRGVGRWLGLAAALAASAGCTAARPAYPPSEPAPPVLARPPVESVVPRTQLFIASWYGRRFHGRITASGRRFDQRAMTAAHRTIAFGTRLRIRNPKNGSEVIVTITDRGPFIRGRDIDLSYGAARRLGLVRTGVSKVEVEVVAEPLEADRVLERLVVSDTLPLDRAAP